MVKTRRRARELDRVRRQFELGRLVRHHERNRRAEAERPADGRQVLGGDVLLREPREDDVDAAAHCDAERRAPLVAPWIVLELVGGDATLAAVVALLGLRPEPRLL